MSNIESLRLQGVEESSTLAMAALAREYKAKGVDVISLSLGEPAFIAASFKSTFYMVRSYVLFQGSLTLT